ncbi:MAG: amidohydrolase [Candidatus Aminicenantes bacterium]|nr:amidohydrolase [Candidatus Aminicenantes bacterium]
MEKADLILFNGKVYTMDSTKPKAAAIAIREGKILMVGDDQEILSLGSRTEGIDLNGKAVLPGFSDAHTHFLDGGMALSDVQLRGAVDRDDFIFRIRSKAQDLKPGEWILNGDWDHQGFAEPELPRKEWIDPVTPGNPVCINRIDKHTVLVNSLALKAAGINRHTDSPPGGKIEKDPVAGEPTGILKDAAINLVSRIIPEPGIQAKKQAVLRAAGHAHSLGVTSVHDMAYSTENFEVYSELLQEGNLNIRVCLYLPIAAMNEFRERAKTVPEQNNRFKLGGLKAFVDGSLGASTALFFEPYLDNPTEKGILISDMYPEGIMEKRLFQADNEKLQVAVHAIGDRANHIILDIMEKVITTNGQRDRRWRIEHTQHIIPDDIIRMGRLGIIASVQPYHAYDDGCWAHLKIGRERVRWSYPFRSLLHAGVKIACGSDWTVAPLNPLLGIFSAVTRKTRDGKHPDGWIPEEKISLEEAVKGFTVNPAFVEGSEDFKGTIAPGKIADIVVLNQDIFSIPADGIENAEVFMTVFDGHIVYQKK